MVRLSKLTDYASVILAQMAKKPDILWSAGQLAEESAIPKPTCIKLLKLLVRGGSSNLNTRITGRLQPRKEPITYPS